MHLSGSKLGVIAAVFGVAFSQDQQAPPQDASALVSSYIPPSVYSQLTASVAAAASAASITGDPGSLLFSALLAPTPPTWFSSAVPTMYSSNVAALESAISNLQAGTSLLPGSTTVLVTTTTNGDGNPVTTTFTSTAPTSTSGSNDLTSTSSSESANAAAPTPDPMQLSGAGLALLAGLAAVF